MAIPRPGTLVLVVERASLEDDTQIEAVLTRGGSRTFLPAQALDINASTASVAATSRGEVVVVPDDQPAPVLTLPRGGPRFVRQGTLGGETMLDPPNLAADSAGGMFAAWDSTLERSGDRLVRVAYRPPGQKFGAARRIARAFVITTDFLATASPEVAAAGNGRAALAWLAIGHRTARLQVATGSPHGFEAPRTLAVVRVNQALAVNALAVDRLGRASVAWTDCRGPYAARCSLWASFERRSGNFDRPMLLEYLGDGYGVDASMAADARGDVVTAWTGYRGIETRVHLASVPAFAETRKRFSGDSFPVVDFGPRGEALLTWTGTSSGPLRAAVYELPHRP